MKRSVNFTGRKPMRVDHMFNLMRWVGMSDDEIRAVADKAKTPLFVNINGEDTVPATVGSNHISYVVGDRQFGGAYSSGDIHEVVDGGEKWYEINDDKLIRE